MSREQEGSEGSVEDAHLDTQTHSLSLSSAEGEHSECAAQALSLLFSRSWLKPLFEE